MNEIKPDTSLYTDLPNKLRALALILESAADREYSRPDETSWQTSLNRPSECLSDLVSGAFDYRIKPKPRELWAVYDETGARRSTYDELDSTDLMRPPGWTVARFVEQP